MEGKEACKVLLRHRNWQGLSFAKHDGKGSLYKPFYSLFAKLRSLVLLLFKAFGRLEKPLNPSCLGRSPPFNPTYHSMIIAFGGHL
jgi:hypothetical protein